MVVLLRFRVLVVIMILILISFPANGTAHPGLPVTGPDYDSDYGYE